jgi:hypothetical protein
MKKTLITLALCIAPGLCFADESRVAEMFQCKIKDGKTMEEIQANNVKWLAMTRKAAGSEEVRSYALTSIVGDSDGFIFIDSFPSLAAWAAAKSAEKSEERDAIEGAFEELMECTENRLYNSTQH